MARAEITIKNQKIPLKSSTGPGNAISAEVIQLAQTLLTNAEKRMKHSAAHEIALIALLELADDYLKAKEGTRAWKQKIYKSADRLASATQATTRTTVRT